MIDLVMWTKDAGDYFPLVLKRINDVIPSNCVHRKILVDDDSSDLTTFIASVFGWEIHNNHHGGISHGANQALKLVDCNYFCSFEQDVLLSLNWWKSVSTKILEGYAACSGVRFLPENNFFVNIDRYLKTRHKHNFGKTLDNTIYRTEAVRAIGGFPILQFAGVDTLLAELFHKSGLKWFVAFDVESLHLHEGFFNELKHYYFYGKSYFDVYRKNLSVAYLIADTLRSFAFSPFRVVHSMHDVRLFLSYPLFRFAYNLGVLKGKRLIYVK